MGAAAGMSDLADEPGGEAEPEQFFLERDAIGTHWFIESTLPIDGETAEHVDRRIAEFDRTYSRFRDDSLVSQARRVPATYTFPDDARDLFDLYDALDRLTGGAVNPLVGDALERLGYDADYRLTRDESRQPAAAPSWRQHVLRDGTALTVSADAGVIDVGAAGKGYLVDLVTDVLRSHGHTDVLVDAGGDIVTTGTRVIGLENPFDSHQAIGTVDLTNAALAGSGINRRSWGGWAASCCGCAHGNSDIGCDRYMGACRPGRCRRWVGHGAILRRASRS